MAQQDKATLKQSFQTGDAPTGSEFANLIDSQLNLAESAAQTVNGQVNFAGGVAFASVSAAVVGGNQATFGTVDASGGNFVRVSARALFGLATAECWATSVGLISTTAINSYVVTNVGTSADTLVQFTHNGSGRLTYTGTLTKTFLIEANYTVSSQSSVQNIGVRIGKDGVSQAKSTIDVRTTAVSAPFVGTVGCLVSLATNSFVEIMATATLNVSPIVFERLNLRVREV